MKLNKQVSQQNKAAINHFFAMHGKKTSEKLSEFLFERLADFAASPNNYNDWYQEECVVNFQLLHDLVNGLKEPI